MRICDVFPPRNTEVASACCSDIAVYVEHVVATLVYVLCKYEATEIDPGSARKALNSLVHFHSNECQELNAMSCG